MKNFITIAAFTAIRFTNCSDDFLNDECILEEIKRKNMIPYNGQSLGCLNYLNMYSFRDELYFQETNNCAYIIEDPFNCEGIHICTDRDSKECLEYFEHRTFIKTVAISEHHNTE